MIADLCKPGDISGIGKARPCVRVLMCGKCDRPLVQNAPVCGECSYCVRLQTRAERAKGKPWWAGADWRP
jgi:hypothetical protein